MSPDRRIDEQSRRRILELDERYRKIASGLVAMMVIVVLSWVGAFLLLENQQSKIQQSRIEALTSLCEQTDKENRAIRSFVEQAAPSLAPPVRKAFPITGACSAWARQVGNAD